MNREEQFERRRRKSGKISNSVGFGYIYRPGSHVWTCIAESATITIRSPSGGLGIIHHQDLIKTV
jgi:hypothetical protein